MVCQLKAVTDELWRRGELDWKLWPQQERIYQQIENSNREAEIIVMLLARQYGKSHLGVLMAIQDCLQNDDVCVLIIGPTIKQTVEIVAPRIKRVIHDAPGGLIKRTKSENKWDIGTSELVIGGWDNSAGSQRGKTLYRIYIEEVVDADPDAFTDILRSDLAPALTHSILGQMVFLTTLPKIPDHPFITDIMPEARLSNSLYSYNLDQNDKLTEEQKAKSIRRAGGRYSIECRREYYNEIVRDPTVLLAPDFDEAKACNNYVKPHRANWQVVLDFGGVKDHTHVIFQCYDYLSNIFVIDSELEFGANTNTSIIMSAIVERSAEYQGFERMSIYADAPGQTRVDLRDNNYAILPVPKTDFKAAINCVNLEFFEGRIRINKIRCPKLVETCRSGTFNKQRTDFARTKALGHMDAMAALSYGLRVVDKSNPWREDLSCPTQNVFIKPDLTPKVTLQKRFGSAGVGAKRMGSFKK